LPGDWAVIVAAADELIAELEAELADAHAALVDRRGSADVVVGADRSSPR